jgi:methyl-accepting chemotaxis protein
MPSSSTLTISRRIVLMISIAVMALLLVGSVGLYVSSKETDSIKKIYSNSLASIETLSEARQTFMQIRVNVYRTLRATDPEVKKGFENQVDSYQQLTLNHFKVYETLLSDSEDKRLLEADLKKLTPYLDLLEKFLIKSRKNEIDHELNQVVTQLASLSTNTRKAIDEHMAYNKKNAESTFKAALASADQGKTIILTMIVISVLALSILGFFLQTNIKKSLHQIQSMVTQIESHLDFTVRVKVTKQDEIGQATTALNRLLDKLQGNLKSIADGAHSVASAASLMSTTSNQVATASHQQSEAASNMAATVEEMTVSINHVGDRAQEANRISTESGELAIQGEKVISQTVSDIKDIATTVNDAAELIHSLEKHSQEISNVIGVIKEVADQTNLLALNAAIEAARAGEQGRGFAVVADEVRKLAERTAISTQEISATINTMRDGASNAVASMEGVVSRVSKGVASAQEANEAIRQIGEGSRHAVGMVEEITSAIREQATATNNIAVLVEKIAQMAEESSAAAGHSADASQNLDQLASDMQQIVAAYKL